MSYSGVRSCHISLSLLVSVYHCLSVIGLTDWRLNIVHSLSLMSLSYWAFFEAASVQCACPFAGDHIFMPPTCRSANLLTPQMTFTCDYTLGAWLSGSCVHTYFAQGDCTPSRLLVGRTIHLSIDHIYNRRIRHCPPSFT